MTQLHTPCSDGWSMSFHCPLCLHACSLVSVLLKMVCSELGFLVTLRHDFNQVSSPQQPQRTLTTASSSAIRSPLCKWTYIEPPKHSAYNTPRSTYFNIHKIRTLPTQHVYLLRVIVTINKYYLLLLSVTSRCKKTYTRWFKYDRDKL